MSQQNHGPQYLAHEGAKISGDPTTTVASQGSGSHLATCGKTRGVAPGSLGRSPGASTAIKQLRAATPVQVGPPPLVPAARVQKLCTGERKRPRSSLLRPYQNLGTSPRESQARCLLRKPP